MSPGHSIQEAEVAVFPVMMFNSLRNERHVLLFPA